MKKVEFYSFHEKSFFEVILTHIRIKYSIAGEGGKTKWKTFVCGFTEPDESRATLKVAGLRGDRGLI